MHSQRFVFVQRVCQARFDTSISSILAQMYLRNTFLDYLRVFNPKGLEKGILTTDGVHLNKMGNLLVATEVARALRKAVLAR